jgi:hypothetical protein
LIRALLRTAVLTVLICLVVSIAWATAPAAELDRLVRLFDTVAFGSEIEGAKPAGRLRKWAGDVRYKVGGAPSARAPVAKHAAALGKLTGLAYRELPGAEKGENLVVMAVPRAKMAEAARAFTKDEAVIARLAEDARGHCFFLSFAKEDRIAYAAIIANAELLPERLDRCLLEEMTQVLGLPNDASGIKEPVAGYKYLGSGLTPAGELLLRALYDPKMAGGSERQRALQDIRGVIAGLLAP